MRTIFPALQSRLTSQLLDGDAVNSKIVAVILWQNGEMVV